MAELSRLLTAVALALGLSVCSLTGVGAQSGDVQVNPDAAVLADFQARLERYLKLQQDLADDAPLHETEEAAEIAVRQELLAAKIRNVRKGARRGDIFTPQVAALFRRLLSPELTGKEGRRTKALIRDDAPTRVPLVINGTYPPNQPLSTVPPNMLARLPRLPEGVEYRIVGNHLILRDVDANIIVDYIPNAIR